MFLPKNKKIKQNKTKANHVKPPDLTLSLQEVQGTEEHVKQHHGK